MREFRVLRRSASIEKPAGESVAMTRADRDALASGGAAAAEHGGAGFGTHARPEAVHFRTVAAVGLKCALGHGDPLLFSKENLLFSNTLSISQTNFGIQRRRALHDVARGMQSRGYAERESRKTDVTSAA
jgi:hypothetical protein